MGIQGTGLSDKNVRLRFLSYIFMGVLAFGVILYWRSQLMLSTEYVQFDNQTTKNKSKKSDVMKSKNYQLETEETSPAVN